MLLKTAKLLTLIDPRTSQRAANVSLTFLTGWQVKVMKGKSMAKGFHLEVKEGSLSRSQKTRTPSPSLLKHTETGTKKKNGKHVALSLSVTHLTQTCDKTSDSAVHVVTRSIRLLTCSLQKRVSVCFPLRIMHKNTEYKCFLCLRAHSE